MSLGKLLMRQPLSPQAKAGRVSVSGEKGFYVVGDFERRRTPVFAPKGYRYLPCEEDRLLLLPLEGGVICLGEEIPNTDLSPGEVEITSVGGANIRLKNSGEVVINGMTISADGQWIPPGGAHGH